METTYDPKLIFKMIEKHKLGDDLVIAPGFLKILMLKELQCLDIF